MGGKDQAARWRGQSVKSGLQKAALVLPGASSRFYVQGRAERQSSAPKLVGRGRAGPVSGALCRHIAPEPQRPHRPRPGAPSCAGAAGAAHPDPPAGPESKGAKLHKIHYIPPPTRPFVIIPFHQPLSNLRPLQETPLFCALCTSPWASHPTALGTTCCGWAGGCRQTPTQVRFWSITCPRDRDIPGVLIWRAMGPWLSRGAWVRCRTCRCGFSARVMGLLQILPSWTRG